MEIAGYLQDLRILECMALAVETSPEDDCETAAGDGRFASCQHQAPLSLGSFWGHLRLQACTARGSFGTVYRAFDTGRGVDVALKSPNADLAGHQANTRLLQEASRLARIRHPGVVKAYGAAIRGQRAGLWMEFVDGRTLDQILRDEGPFLVSEAARIGYDLCDALGAVHAAGLIHGDIKPQNVMCGENGRVVLVDFGSACEIQRPARSGRHITGTPLYLAPEVITECAASVSGDIYSLGVLLFHLASGDYPVQAESVEALADAHRRGAVRRLQDLRPDLLDEFCRTVDRALTIDPQGRYGSAAEMRAALGRIATGSRAA